MCSVLNLDYFFSFDLYIIETIIITNPMKHTNGAITIRRVLKISGSKATSVEPGPVIKMNPRIISATEMAINI